MLNISMKNGTSDFQEFVIDNIDIKLMLEKCLTSQEISEMKQGVLFLGTLIQFEGNEVKLMKAVQPEILEYVDHNIFGKANSLFQDGVSIEQKLEQIDLVKYSLWMLSNYVSNQKIDGYTEVMIISKNLYSQII